MATTFGAVLSLKDNFTATMRKAQKEQSKFKRDVEKTKSELEKAYKQKYELRIKNAQANKMINQTIKKLAPIRKHIINMVAKTSIAMSQISKVASKLNPLKKVHNIVLKGKDMISPMLDKVKKGISSVVKMASGVTLGAVAGGGALLGKGIKDGAMLEQQMISMEHFIGVNNTGKSKDEVKAMTDAYMNDLRSNANSTPFTTNEVISAGTRALNVAGGDTSMAQSFLRLAEDMSALNPEKSLSDAMEALADLKVGETERMKEFGFKISAEDIKASGGDFSKLANSEGIALTDMFKGGAEKLSTSGAGLWSTVVGKLGSGLTDMGKSTLDALKPVLERVIVFVDKITPKMAEFGTKIGEGIGKAMEWFDKISPVVKQVVNDIKPVISNLVSLFTERMEAMKPILQSFVGFVQGVFPIVKDIISTVGAKVGEVFSYMSQNCGGLQEAFSKAFPIIQDVIKVAWSIMKPVVDAIGEGIKVLWDCFNVALTGIVDVVSWAWDIIKPIFNLIEGAVSGVTGAVKSTIDTVKGWFGGKTDVTVSSDNGGKKRAMGVARVPYDNYPIMAHEGEVLLTKKEAKGVGNGKTIIEKIADTIIVREDADIDRIADALVRKLEVSSMAYGGAY